MSFEVELKKLSFILPITKLNSTDFILVLYNVT